MSLLDRIDEKVPGWMLRLRRRHVGKLMAGVAAMLDAAALQVVEARFAALPGQVRLDGVEGLGGYDNVDALPKIGRDRSIRRGLSELPWDYAERLRRWLDSWAIAGTPYAMLEQLAGILGPDPGVIRIVTAGGCWWSRLEDGSIVYQNVGGTGFDWTPSAGALTQDAGVAHAWDWDSITSPPPPDQNDASRWWVILYAGTSAPFVETDDGTTYDFGCANDLWDHPGTAAPNAASPDMGLAGMATPRKWLDLVRSVIRDWSAAGAACSHVIVSFDASAFNPITDGSPTSVPDGAWGYSTKYDAGALARVASRFVNAAYLQAYPDEP